MTQRGIPTAKTVPSPAWWNMPGAGEAAGPAWHRAISIVLLALVAYSPVVHAGFIWDDDYHVSNNPTLTNVSGLRNIWLEPLATPQYYPLVHTTFWLEYHLWGLHPLGYHLINVLLHAANALLLWCVLRRLGVPGAFWAAALFAVHPVHVESVAWVSERKNVLSALCYLGSFLLWLRFSPTEEISPRVTAGRWLYYAGAVLLFVAALLSKTVTCSLPAVFLLVRWWKHGRVSRRDVLLTAPLFLIGLALAAHTVYLEKHHVGAQGDEWKLSFVARLLIAGRAVWFYAGKLVWPARLTFIYPRWQIDVTSAWQILFPVAALAVLLGLVASCRRLGRGPLVAVLFFAGTLLPALGFFDVYPMRFSFVADHFQYLASAGLLVLAGAGIQWLLARLPRGLSWTTLGLLFALLGALTWRQAGVYHDALTLWDDTLAKNPSCWMAYANRGMAHLERGEAEQSLADYTRAIELNPDQSVKAHPLAASYTLRGNSYRQLGQTEQAIRDHTRAIELGPEYSEAYASRGLDYHLAGRLQQAITDFTRAIELKPDADAAFADRGAAYHQLGQTEKAIRDFTRAIELKTDGGGPGLAGVYIDRGVAYQKLGQAEQAIRDLNRAIELDPISAAAYSNRGMTYQQLGQAQQANADFTRAIELKPDFADAYYNRGNLHQQMGQAQPAIRDCTRAIELKPELALAYGTRAIVYHEQGKLELAIRDYTRALELSPDYLGAYCNRAIAYQQAGQIERAVQDYSQALTVQPNSPTLYLNRAMLNCKSGQYGAAWSDVQRAQELGGTPDPSLLYSLRQATNGSR